MARAVGVRERNFFVQYLSSGHGIALVWGAAPQTRSDRRKDRVETNPEQLAAASAQAEISLHMLY
jgi:BRCA1/BRCA2-containing complex subunit 3